MKDYFAFGGCFRSEVEFPDLSPFPGSEEPDWTVEISTSGPGEPGELQGVREFDGGWALRLYRLRDGLRLDYGATGSYEIRDGGRRIVWYPGPDRREEVVRAVILGPLIALALHEAGTLCLHGSAVSLEGRGIGFLAPKGYGKSTLAAVLAAAGGQLMSDDLVAVTTSPAPELLPSVHSIRMWSDVEGLMADTFPGASVRDGYKKTMTNLPAHRLGWSRVPLDTLYLITRSPETGDEPPRRTRAEPLEATLALARNTKLTDELIGNVEAGRMLQWIARLVPRIPVYRLELPWDLQRLPRVTEEILSWHPAR